MKTKACIRKPGIQIREKLLHQLVESNGGETSMPSLNFQLQLQLQETLVSAEKAISCMNECECTPVCNFEEQG